MLRRVGRVLRAGLLVAGLLLAFSLPLSFFFQASYSQIVSYETGVAVWCEQGAVGVGYASSIDLGLFFEGFDWGAADDHWRVGPVLWVLYERQPLDPSYLVFDLFIPLWLLAFICLAWPVTSFIIARRRRKGRGFEVEAKRRKGRGFEVEAGPGAAVPPPDS